MSTTKLVVSIATIPTRLHSLDRILATIPHSGHNILNVYIPADGYAAAMRKALWQLVYFYRISTATPDFISGDGRRSRGNGRRWDASIPDYPFTILDDDAIITPEYWDRLLDLSETLGPKKMYAMAGYDEHGRWIKYKAELDNDQRLLWPNASGLLIPGEIAQSFIDDRLANEMMNRASPSGHVFDEASFSGYCWQNGIEVIRPAKGFQHGLDPFLSKAPDSIQKNYGLDNFMAYYEEISRVTGMPRHPVFTGGVERE